MKSKTILLLVAMIAISMGLNAQLFISEYIEGTGTTKVIEIFNPLTTEVVLSPYHLRVNQNGGANWSAIIPLSGVIAPQGILIAYNSTDATLNAHIATVSALEGVLAINAGGALSHNGDDPVVLFYNDEPIDTFGNAGGGQVTIAVAGDATAGQDHTIIRKPTVAQGNLNWAASAGTNEEDSEWVVYPVGTYSNLGYHTFTDPTEPPDPPVAPLVFTPDEGEYYTPQSLTITTETPAAAIYYTTNGSNPTDTASETCFLYSTPIELTQTTTIKARGFKAGHTPTSIFTKTYTFPMPIPPTNVACSITDSDITITWAITSQTILTGFNVYRSELEEGGFAMLNAPGSLDATTRSYIDQGLTYGTYYYYVEALYTEERVMVSATLVVVFDEGVPLFISEYVEGTGTTKVIEIFNPTATEVNLSGYSLRVNTNGGAGWGTLIPFSGAIASHGVLIVYNSTDATLDAHIASVSALEGVVLHNAAGVLQHNGDDPVVLFRNGQPIDTFGNAGSGQATIAVAGDASAGQDHTIIRKPTVYQGNLDWAASAGTDADDSEWVIYPSNTFDDLGYHTFTDPTDPPDPQVAPLTFLPEGGTYNTTQSVIISTTTPDALIYYTIDGAEPNQASTLYSGAITVAVTTTIKARGYKAGYTPSAVATAVYTIQLPPVILPPTNLTAVVENYDVVLTWQAPEGEGVTPPLSYNIYRKLSTDAAYGAAIGNAVGITFTDNGDALEDAIYHYVVKAVYSGGQESEASNQIAVDYVPESDSDETAVAGMPGLHGNYPNPFNPSTTISFNVATADVVTIDIYNIRGQHIKSLISGVYAKGTHNIVWNGLDDSGHNVGNGVYLYRMTAGGFTQTRKMVILK